MVILGVVGLKSSSCRPRQFRSGRAGSPPEDPSASVTATRPATGTAPAAVLAERLAWQSLAMPCLQVDLRRLGRRRRDGRSGRCWRHCRRRRRHCGPRRRGGGRVHRGGLQRRAHGPGLAPAGVGRDRRFCRLRDGSRRDQGDAERGQEGAEVLIACPPGNGVPGWRETSAPDRPCGNRRSRQWRRQRRRQRRWRLEAGQPSGTRFTNGSPRSNALRLSSVVAMIWPMASTVKKAWCPVTITFGKDTSRWITSSWITVEDRSWKNRLASCS